MPGTVPIRFEAARGQLVAGPPEDPNPLQVVDDGYSAHREAVADVGAADLRKALARARGIEGDYGDLTLFVSEVDIDIYDSEYSPYGTVALVLDADNKLALDIQVFVRDYPDDDPSPNPALQALLGPLLVRRGAKLISAAAHDAFVVPPYLLEIRVQPTMRGRTVGDLLELGHAVEELVSAAEGDELDLTRTTVRDLVRGGRADILLGQPEGPWLDVKKQAYELKAPAGKISLAQAVARFANAEHGGLLVIGMGTKAVPGGETINSINPFPVDGTLLRQHSQAVQERLFPPPDFLTIEAVEVAAGGHLILIDIPPQPEELKPFLVHGAIVEGKVEGAFISIVRRRGEDSIPVTAAAIHSTLAAGRALLRRGQLPEPQ